MINQINSRPPIELMKEKSQVSAIKKMIQKKLNVDAGTQSVLDIQAVAQGYKNFNTAKGLAKKNFYTAKANLGSNSAPYFITKELGIHENQYQAIELAKEVLKDCQQFLTWNILVNKNDTCYTVETKPFHEKGFIYNIRISGQTLDDVAISLEEVKNSIENKKGSNNNDWGAYSFDSVGEEYAQDEEDDYLFDESLIKEYDTEFAVFDINNIKLSLDGSEKSLEKWHQRNSNNYSVLKHMPWKQFLVLGQRCSAEYMKENQHMKFHAIPVNGGDIFEGDYDNVGHNICRGNQSYYLFVQTDISYFL
jgi:hypothetical protein